MIHKNAFRNAIATIALCLLSGCHSDASGAVEENAHQLAPHKPAGFVEAVQTIRDRLARFHATDASSDREVRRQQVRELKDIIQWLPEQAAETDMRKADWDNVNASTKRMAARG